ncbi:hypothetical protein REPUB_Repub08aG0120800 [Reevesia pubescens]
MRMLFSKIVGVADAIFVEILVVKKATLMFAASSWAGSNELIIECDSSNVVN